MHSGEGTDNLWLARALFDLDGVEFGSFTVGRSTVNSPIYINPRVVISEPDILRRAAELIRNETASAIYRRRPRAESFDLVAGVPFGGLHLATAFSLMSGVPMIYTRPPRTGGLGDMIEGRYKEGQTVLIVDDLITTGGSIIQTKALLEEAGLRVRDAVVFVDREQGAGDRLKRHGVNLISILKLKVMLKYYLATDLIDSDQFHRSMQYIEANRATADWSPPKEETS
jgi:orotate phosphoribosyltransferase/uridine monophosphate synthetase